MDLSFEQLEVVRATEKQIVVVAQAGSGKTRTLTERINHLLQKGVDASKIFAITYTNMAAQEITERLYGKANIFAGTIHGLANQILRQNKIDTSEAIAEEAFDKLLTMMKQKNIILPEIEHLLIDEFQDICDNEYEFIVQTLKYENIFFVGDSCQSIYSFKGGNYKHFMRLLNDKNTKVYTLKDNYRNASLILEFSEQFLNYMDDVYRIDYNVKNKLPGFVETFSDFTPELIDKIKKDGESEKYNSWFILCRTNAQITQTIGMFARLGIPCTTFKKSENSLSDLRTILNENSVKILTIHSAKGLEADKVVVLGAKTFSSEEKRICYVACTRARYYLAFIKEQKKHNKRRNNASQSVNNYTGATINFNMIDNSPSQTSPRIKSRNDVFMEQTFRSFDREKKNKYAEYFDTDEEHDSYLPDLDQLNSIWESVWF